MKADVVGMVARALEVHGPCSSMDLHRITGVARNQIRNVVSLMHRTHKSVHIADWVRDTVGSRTYLRARYALGNRRDAPRPPPFTHTQSVDRYRRRCAAIASASVFTLGTRVDALRKSIHTNRKAA